MTDLMKRTDFTPAERADVRRAATILLVRDGEGPQAGAIEVFMMKRPSGADFGELHVFPGGKVDAADLDPAVLARCRGRDDADACRRLGLPAGAIAYWVAAVRECFEESGVLLACDPDGGEPPHDAAWANARDRLLAGHAPFRDALAQLDIHLALDRVHYFSHWFTPEGPPRRYDTRFFVVRAPGGQHGSHDERELVASEWVTAADALARQQRGEWGLIFPTRTTLVSIGRHATVDALLAAVQRGTHLPAHTPELAREGMQAVRFP